MNLFLPFDENSAYIGCGRSQLGFTLVKKLGLKLIRLNPFFWNFSKGFIMIIRKILKMSVCIVCGEKRFSFLLGQKTECLIFRGHLVSENVAGVV